MRSQQQNYMYNQDYEDDNEYNNPEKINDSQVSNNPVKTQIRSFEASFSQMRKDLIENVKICHEVRSECGLMEHKTKEGCNDLMQQILHDIESLEQNFKKIMQQDNNEFNFLRQQNAGLIQEKTKLQQSLITLDARVLHMEHEIGYE